MENLFNLVEDLLLSDSRYVSEDNNVLKAKVYTDVMSMDEELISLLLGNEKVRDEFFVEVKDTLVFDKQKFAWLIESKEFLPDSYTRYSNKIGLTSNGRFISQKNDVVLDFPYKDCYLQGGQDKEDQKRDEIFYHETIASDEVTRMLAPKVFTNAKRYTKDGIEENIEFNDEDNLIIKGNNLIALSSLLKRYEGKIKLIYIDPPYNTGKKNSFGYNDSFNHSSWLTFMKNRLEIAKKLLSPDGVFLVQTDDKEQAYLKVLCDEIFGREQFETSFFVQVRFTNKTLAEDSALHKVIETIHVYSKSHSSFNINKIKEEYSIEKFCWKITETGQHETIEVGGKVVDIFKDGNYTIEKVSPDYHNLKETWATGSLIRQGGTAAEFLAKYLIDRKKEDGLKVLYKVHNMGEDGLGYRYILGPQRESAFRGKFYSGIPTSILEGIKSGEYRKELPVPNFIYNYLGFESEFGNCRTEGNVDIEGGKKPEQLIKFLLEYFSQENDIVLDFFIGSGTTAATAHKMSRKYIGVEQLDYGKNDSVVRLENVLKGDSTGISKDVDWQGGGSFVYCELLENSKQLITEIQNATNQTIADIKDKIYRDERIVPYITTEELEAVDTKFEELNLEDKKKALCALVDKNKLYVNLSDINDETYDINESDKKFTESFYKGEV